MNHWQAIHEEEGVELIEFIGVLPLIFIMILIGWQFFLAGHTIISGMHGAREGARAMAVCGDAVSAVRRASPSYSPQVAPFASGNAVGVKVTYAVPMVRIPYIFNDTHQIPLTFQATMRKERC